MDENALSYADHGSAVPEVWWAIGGQTRGKKKEGKEYDTWHLMSQIHGIPTMLTWTYTTCPHFIIIIF